MPTDNDIVIAIAAERLANRKIKNPWEDKFRGFKIVDPQFDEPGTHGNGPKIRIAPEDLEKCAKTEDELIAALGRKWKTVIPRLGQFCSCCLGRAHDETLDLPNGEPFAFKQIAIACTSKALCSIFGNPREVSRLIEKARETGFLVRLTQTYRFGSKNKDRNYSHQYACNETVAKLIRDTCQKRNINIPRIIADREKTYALLNGKDPDEIGNGRKSGKGKGEGKDSERKGRGITASDPSLVDRFAASLGLTAKDVLGFSLAKRHLGLKDIEDWKIKKLAEWKYSELVKPRKVKIAKMNNGLQPNEQIRFEPNVKRDRRGYVMRVGWRATNSIVSLKAHENDNPDYKGRWRKDYLDELFGEDGYFEYDVRASIYQISHLLNFGEWVGNKSDPYEIMFGEEFRSKEERNAFKDFCMALYFDRPSEILTHNQRRIPECLKRFGKEKLKEVISAAERNMTQFTGAKLFNEVFLHESLLYIDFVLELRRAVIWQDVVQIYDGFYIKHSCAKSREELDKMMLDCALQYYADYRKWKESQHLIAARALA